MIEMHEKHKKQLKKIVNGTAKNVQKLVCQIVLEIVGPFVPIFSQCEIQIDRLYHEFKKIYLFTIIKAEIQNPISFESCFSNF